MLVKLILVLLFAIAILKYYRSNNYVENFSNNKKIIEIESDDIYDKFYSNIYDQLFGDGAKNKFEIKEITKHALNLWKDDIKILDVGCGTGWHTHTLSKKYNELGIDRSIDMLKKARKLNPKHLLKLGNVKNNSIFRAKEFSHILCLYFTIYYIDNLNLLFKNFNKWLKKNGVAVIHVVNRNKFDPLLSASSPFPVFSLQKYSKKRLTKSKVHFNNFVYEAQFKLDDNKGNFIEQFNYKKRPYVRKQTHELNIPTIDEIVRIAANNGFKLYHKVGMIPVSFEYHYLYFFKKL